MVAFRKAQHRNYSPIPRSMRTFTPSQHPWGIFTLNVDVNVILSSHLDSSYIFRVAHLPVCLSVCLSLLYPLPFCKTTLRRFTTARCALGGLGLWCGVVRFGPKSSEMKDKRRPSFIRLVHVIPQLSVPRLDLLFPCFSFYWSSVGLRHAFFTLLYPSYGGRILYLPLSKAFLANREMDSGIISFPKWTCCCYTRGFLFSSRSR